MESVQICLPISKQIISSSTTSDVGITLRSPSRMTTADGADTSDSLSIFILERIS